MSDSRHWDRVYTTKDDHALSWFQVRAHRSLALIEDSGFGPDAAIIDVGGGTSTLIAALLERGYSDLWVLDISPVALAAARGRLGDAARRVHWVEGDVTAARLSNARFDIWHDRAVFHFLVDAAARAAYVAQAVGAVRPGGNAIIGTFAEDGPDSCSGLPVLRYSAPALLAEFGDAWELLHTEKELHRTPAGGIQPFRYCRLRRRA